MKSKNLAVFGRYVAGLRVKMGFTQQQVAYLMSQEGKKISQSCIAQLETGKITNPDVDFLKRLSKCLGVEYSEVLVEFVSDKYGCRLSVLTREVPSSSSQNLKQIHSLIIIAGDMLAEVVQTAQK